MAAKLAAAPAWASVLSLMCYLSIWWRGVGFALGAFGVSGGDIGGDDAGDLRRAVVEMTVLYATECVLALGFNYSTLAGWRRIDFQLHHLPYALLVGGSVVAKVGRSLQDGGGDGGGVASTSTVPFPLAFKASVSFLTWVSLPPSPSHAATRFVLSGLTCRRRRNRHGNWQHRPAKVPIFEAYPLTLPLTLCTSMNEAVTIGWE